MIHNNDPKYIVTDSVFDQAHAVIIKSGVAQTIQDYYRKSIHNGGRPSNGIEYTPTAVLTALLIRCLIGLPYSMRGAMETIGALSPTQLAAVGMGGQDCTAIHTDAAREYKRFHRYWFLRMQPLDPDFDLPSQRMTNAEFDAIIAARTEDDRQRSRLADARLNTIINDLLAGSIDDPRPANCDGDVVVDETTINTVGFDTTLGTRSDRYRAASSCGRSWKRGYDYAMKDADATENNKPASGEQRLKSAGFGVGATFVTRVGPRDALHTQPPLFIGMAVHYPTSASVEGLATALDHAHRTGVDARPENNRCRWPLLTADMGYNDKKGFPELMIATGYSPVVRYPQKWNLTFVSANPPGTPDKTAPGPVQHAGAFYCPAAGQRLVDHDTPKTEELLKHGGFRKHDQRLRMIYPFLMGHHSRPTLAEIRHGRPAIGQQPDKGVKIRLVCPAALGLLKCPLKPDSLDLPDQIPQAEPTWSAETFACCANSSVTITLTADQLRLAQWELIPGSWEHTLYFEAARALTEQRFSQLKSPFVAGLADLITGPRRTPMIKIAIALAAATVNIYSQRHHDPNANRHESIDIRWRHVGQDLGYPPIRMPRRS